MQRGKGEKMKRLLTPILLLVLALSLAGCGTFMSFQIGEANRIHIRSEAAGLEAEVSDPASIQRLTEEVNALQFEQTAPADGQDAYVYQLTWFDAEENPIAEITITEENGHQIRHDGFYYKVAADQNIDTDLIETMLE